MNDSVEVTLEEIEEIIKESEEKVFIVWENKEMFVSYKLPSGHTISGRSGVVNPSKFDYQKGYEVAREKAKEMLWAYEAYHRIQKYYEATLDN